MNQNLSSQLDHLISVNPKLDAFNFYFLGLCHEYASENSSLERLLTQLSSKFLNLSLNFIQKNINQLNDIVGINERKGSIVSKTSKIERDFQPLLQDFDVLPRVYPKLSKAQWFYLGTFMVRNPALNPFSIIRNIYIEADVKFKNEPMRVENLVSFLRQEYKEKKYGF